MGDMYRYLSLAKLIKDFLREVKQNSRAQQSASLGPLGGVSPNRISMEQFDRAFHGDGSNTKKSVKDSKPTALEPKSRDFDVRSCNIVLNPQLNLLGGFTPSDILEKMGISEGKFATSTHEMLCTNMEKTLKILNGISIKMDKMFKH